MSVQVDVKWNIPIVNRVVAAPIINRKIQKVLEVAQATCPVGNGPTAGQMRDSLVATMESMDPPRGIVECRDPKYKYVANGTEAHDEWASGEAMAFVPKSGSLVLAKHVVHPGTRPNPFLKNALRQVVGGNE